MSEPTVDHSDVADFVDEKVNLRREKVDRYREQVRSLRRKLDAHIEAHPGYALVKMLNAGSVQKGTAISRLNDMDVAVYVKAAEAPEDESRLLFWLADRLREAYPNLDPDQFEVKHHCVTVSFRGSGLDVDVVPVLYDGLPDDRGCLIAKDTGERLETSIPLHIEFIRSRRRIYGPAFTEFIRMVKWWVDSVRRAHPEKNFRFKSFLVELICAHLVDTGQLGLDDYPKGLEQFFAYLVKTSLADPIVFSDYYDPREVTASGLQVIEIYDPVNPSNNVARNYDARDQQLIVATAQDAFDALSDAYYATTQGRSYEGWREVLGSGFGR
jgi:hypothetical protein